MEKLQSALAVEEEEQRLCLTEEVGVAGLHELEAFGVIGSLALVGLGEEGGDRRVLGEVEGLGRSPALEADAPVCQVEVVEEDHRCSPPS